MRRRRERVVDNAGYRSRYTRSPLGRKKYYHSSNSPDRSRIHNSSHLLPGPYSRMRCLRCWMAGWTSLLSKGRNVSKYSMSPFRKSLTISGQPVCRRKKKRKKTATKKAHEAETAPETRFSSPFRIPKHPAASPVRRSCNPKKTKPNHKGPCFHLIHGHRSPAPTYTVTAELCQSDPRNHVFDLCCIISSRLSFLRNTHTHTISLYSHNRAAASCFPRPFAFPRREESIQGREKWGRLIRGAGWKDGREGKEGGEI